MLIEILIVLEIVAFVFLALGIIPYGKKETGEMPLLNKIVFILIAAIIFGSLAFTSNAYDYNYCYVNETVSNFALNSTTSTATCDNYVIYNPELSYINLGLCFLSVVLMIIVSIVTALTRQENRFIDE